MRKSELVVLGIILLSFIIGLYFYPKMPAQVASHWNVKGEVDGYMSKLWGLFLMPVVTAAMFILFIIIPKIDPLKANIAKFRNYYNRLIVLIVVFLFYIYVLTIVWNLGWTFGMTQFLAPAFGILFFYMGILLKNAKRNWFIGIRNPWTLSSDVVWEKTHRLGGKLFKFGGILTLFGIFCQDYAIFFILLPVVIFLIYTTVYSYVEYQKEIGGKTNGKKKRRNKRKG